MTDIDRLVDLLNQTGLHGIEQTIYDAAAQLIAAGVTLDPRPDESRLFAAVRAVIANGIDSPGVHNELHAAFYEQRDLPRPTADPKCDHRWSAVMACDFCDAHDPITDSSWDSCCGLLEGHDGDHMPSRILAIRADPRPAPDAALRKAAQAFMDQEVDWIGDRPYYIYAGRPPIAILAALRAALAPADREEES